MFQRIVVPFDGSPRALDAVRAAVVIGAQCDAPVEAVEVVPWMTKVADAQADLERALDRLDAPVPGGSGRPAAVIAEGEDDVATVIAAYAAEVDGTMIVMSSTGRGRAAAVLGSVADELVSTMFGPIIVVGPKAATSRPLTGAFVVPVDGSAHAETSLPLAGAWGIALGGTPWLVEVVTPHAPGAVTAEAEYTTRLAADLRALTRHPVEAATVHGIDPATSIAEFAGEVDASLILMSTHGRTGLKRLTLGSVAADTIRQAPCPVVLHRPPTLPG